MIKEVAIDPEVMATWQHFRELWADLGVTQGRLVAEYPPGWRDIVCEKAYKVSSAKAASIAARLKPLPGNGGAKRWVATNRGFDRGKDWLTNAEKHDVPGGFAAIVAKKNPRAKRCVLTAGEFDPEVTPWSTASQLEVTRDTTKLLECSEFLLRVSHELVLVEPNFDVTEGRFRDPLEALVNCRAKGQSWSRLELHVRFPTDKQGNYVPSALPSQMGNARHFLAPLIPVGNTLHLFFWQRKVDGKRIHARYIMTELGGLQPDHGLDEGDALGDTTIVSLLAEDVWTTVRGDYCAASQTYKGEPGWQTDIAGQKP